MRAATARALAPASGYDPRGGRRRAAASSRPWSAVPTLHGSSSSTPSSGTPRVSARRRRSVVSATSATSKESTREGESGDARQDVPGATAPSPTPGAEVDASASRDDPGTGARSLTPGQRRAAEKKAIHAKRHPNGHDKQVSLHLRAKAKARRGDKKGALEELRRGAARFPKNAHIGVSFARALADDFDESDESDGSLDGETNALLRALNHLDVLEDVMSPTDVSKSHVYQLRGVLEARRLELFVKDPGSVSSGLVAPSAGRARAAFEASVAADPRHWAAWHAWGIFEMRRGRVNKARRLLREARRSDPRRARTAQTLAALEASVFFGEKNAAALHSARSLFAEAIALDATHAPSYTAWARMEQRAGNVTRAARVFRQGEEATRNAARDATAYGVIVTKSRRDDVDGDPLFSRSALLAAYGAFEARRAPGSVKARSHARTLFREACDCGGRRNPRAFAAWAAAETAFVKSVERRGGGVRESEDTRESEDAHESNALRVLAEGLRLHPGNERLLHAQACALRLAGDAESAVAAFEALLSSHSRATRNPKTWHALGGALRDAGRFDDAVDAFERGAFCRFADDGSLNNEMDAYAKMDGMETFVNLPCLTSAAAEAARGGDAARARRLFARGSALASPGEDALSPFETFFDTFETDGGSTVDGSTVSVSNATDRGANDARGARWPSRNTRGTRAARSGFQKDAVSARPSAHERSTHLRMWAAFEKRDGRYVTARALFARASRANPGDALVWLQWGQFERRVEGPDAARTRFQSGAKRVARATSARAFLYQAWADLEASVGDVDAARAVYERAIECHPGSPELWLARGAFEAELARARTNATEATATPSVDARACFARAAALSAGTAFARSVRDARRAYGDLDLEDARGAAGGARGEERSLFDGSDEDARGLGLAEW